MDDILSIIEDMLKVMSGTALPNSVTAQCADELMLLATISLMDRVRDIRKRQEQECLQEAEDTYECLQQDEDGTRQREDYLCMRYPHAQGD